MSNNIENNNNVLQIYKVITDLAKEYHVNLSNSSYGVTNYVDARIINLIMDISNRRLHLSKNDRILLKQEYARFILSLDGSTKYYVPKHGYYYVNISIDDMVQYIDSNGDVGLYTYKQVINWFWKYCPIIIIFVLVFLHM